MLAFSVGFASIVEQIPAALWQASIVTASAHRNRVVAEMRPCQEEIHDDGSFNHCHDLDAVSLPHPSKILRRCEATEARRHVLKELQVRSWRFVDAFLDAKRIPVSVHVCAPEAYSALDSQTKEQSAPLTNMLMVSVLGTRRIFAERGVAAKQRPCNGFFEDLPGPQAKDITSACKQISNLNEGSRKSVHGRTINLQRRLPLKMTFCAS